MATNSPVPLSEQPETASLAPKPKVAAAGIAGAVTAIAIWLLRAAVRVEVPPEVASATTTVLAFGAGYLKKG